MYVCIGRRYYRMDCNKNKNNNNKTNNDDDDDDYNDENSLALTIGDR